MKHGHAGVRAVVFDWAGTTIDYGCQAPLRAFTQVFAERGIAVTEAEVRAFMGLPKRDHLASLLGLESARAQWAERFGEVPGEEAVDAVYEELRPTMLKAVAERTELIPGAYEAANMLRERGVRIGSTTGYDAAVMKVVASVARVQGYVPDALATPDEVPTGRPAPFLMYLNAIRLEVYPMACVLKVGDTIADVEEGRNAGAWSAGVILGGSELGLDAAQVSALDPSDLAERMAVVRDRLAAAGAHLVLDSIFELENAVETVETALADGWTPDV